MPSPFPGMNPYLEEPYRWQDVHNSLIIYARAAIAKILPPQYMAAIEERVYIVPDENRHYIPDVHIRARPQTGVALAERQTALAEEGDPPLHIAYYSEEVHEIFIEIRDVKNQGRVVTAIEVLSPTNKADTAGRESYQNKQAELLASQANFLEIDLLRSGRHTVAVPLELLPPRKEWNYMTCLHRGGKKGEFEVWPNRLPNRLPRIRVPLDADVPDLILDLQAVLHRAYDEGGYERQADYTQSPPAPPLSEEDAAWADALLREHNLRP